MDNEKKDYIFAATRVHYHELGLLSGADLEQLVNAKDVSDVFRMLADKGWGSPELPVGDADALIHYELKRTWDLIGELAGSVAEFNVFRYANDYNNLKAAIKLAYAPPAEADTTHYFMPYGTVDVDLLQKAAGEHVFTGLPGEMAEAGRLAYEELAHTGNGQVSDMIIDRAALVAIGRAGADSGSELLLRYTQLTVDFANIKTAVRCCKMKKNRDLIERAIAPAGTLNANLLVDAAASDLESLYAYIAGAGYGGAVEALKISMAAYERWCDNQLIALIRPERHNYFTIEPLAAFILGRENEIRMVRLILSAKQNHLSEDTVRERLRDMYV